MGIFCAGVGLSGIGMSKACVWVSVLVGALLEVGVGGCGGGDTVSLAMYGGLGPSAGFVGVGVWFGGGGCEGERKHFINVFWKS